MVYSTHSEWIPKQPLFNQVRVQHIVVIPCYNEPGLPQLLQSIQEATMPHPEAFGLLFVVNASDMDSELVLQQNNQSVAQIQQWAPSVAMPVTVYQCMLPAKDAGVGLARKIGMDAAVDYLKRQGTSDHSFLICLDADCTVSNNYFVEIEQFIKYFPKMKAFNIHFEHPTQSDEDTNLGITLYELHLRYYVHAMRYARHPYAFQTIGSSMAVRADVYTQSGGMNKLKAGEDFYFLKKIIPLGGFGVLTSATVYPSSRVSTRVPFGTGKAMEKWQQAHQCTSYHFKSFELLRMWFQRIPGAYTNQDPEHLYQGLPEHFQNFLNAHHTTIHIQEIRANSADVSAFTKRFYQWFDLFMVMKYVHHMRLDPIYADQPVLPLAAYALVQKGVKINNPNNAFEVLQHYRIIDKVPNQVYTANFKNQVPFWN